MRAVVITVLSALAAAAVGADQDPYSELLLSRVSTLSELHGDLTMSLVTMDADAIKAACTEHTSTIDHDRPQLSITEYQLQGEVLALEVSDRVAIDPLKDLDTSAVDAISYRGPAVQSRIAAQEDGSGNAQGWTIYHADEIAKVLHSLRQHCIRQVREIVIRHYVTDRGVHGGGHVVNEIAPAALDSDMRLRLIAGDRELWSSACDMATGQLPGLVNADLPTFIPQGTSRDNR